MVYTSEQFQDAQQKMIANRARREVCRHQTADHARTYYMPAVPAPEVDQMLIEDLEEARRAFDQARELARRPQRSDADDIDLDGDLLAALKLLLHAFKGRGLDLEDWEQELGVRSQY